MVFIEKHVFSPIHPSIYLKKCKKIKRKNNETKEIIEEVIKVLDNRRIEKRKYIKEVHFDLYCFVDLLRA